MLTNIKCDTIKCHKNNYYKKHYKNTTIMLLAITSIIIILLLSYILKKYKKISNLPNDIINNTSNNTALMDNTPINSSRVENKQIKLKISDKLKKLDTVKLTGFFDLYSEAFQCFNDTVNIQSEIDNMNRLINLDKDQKLQQIEILQLMCYPNSDCNNAYMNTTYPNGYNETGVRSTLETCLDKHICSYRSIRSMINMIKGAIFAYIINNANVTVIDLYQQYLSRDDIFNNDNICNIEPMKNIVNNYQNKLSNITIKKMIEITNSELLGRYYLEFDTIDMNDKEYLNTQFQYNELLELIYSLIVRYIMQIEGLNTKQDLSLHVGDFLNKYSNQFLYSMFSDTIKKLNNLIGSYKTQFSSVTIQNLMENCGDIMTNWINTCKLDYFHDDNTCLFIKTLEKCILQHAQQIIQSQTLCVFIKDNENCNSYLEQKTKYNKILKNLLSCDITMENLFDTDLYEWLNDWYSNYRSSFCYDIFIDKINTYLIKNHNEFQIKTNQELTLQDFKDRYLDKLYLTHKKNYHKISRLINDHDTLKGVTLKQLFGNNEEIINLWNNQINYVIVINKVLRACDEYLKNQV